MKLMPCFHRRSILKAQGIYYEESQKVTWDKFAWKLNVPVLKDKLNEITRGIQPGKSDFREVSGFPVIILKGEDSAYISPEDYPAIMKPFPEAEFEIIPGSGHWIHADNPEALRKSFLRLRA